MLAFPFHHSLPHHTSLYSMKSLEESSEHAKGNSTQTSNVGSSATSALSRARRGSGSSTGSAGRGRRSNGAGSGRSGRAGRSDSRAGGRHDAGNRGSSRRSSRASSGSSGSCERRGDGDGDTSGAAEAGKGRDGPCGMVSVVKKGKGAENVLAASSAEQRVGMQDWSELVMAAWPVVHWQVTSVTPQPEPGMAATRQATFD